MRSSKGKSESNGSKVVRCVRCGTDIQPYAGRSVALIRGQYAHHPGQCADVAEREAAVRQLAGQGTLFGWRCDHVEPGDVTGYVCAETGTDRGEYVAHMKGHGKRLPAGTARVRLRKGAPSGQPAQARGARVQVGDLDGAHLVGMDAEAGTQLISERERRGQFWAQADGTHCYWYMPFDGERKPVRLYARGDGTLTRDWSEAAESRREANRRAKRHGLAA